MSDIHMNEDRRHPSFLTIDKLSSSHRVADFRCGKPELDAFISRYALGHPRQGLSQTWVAVHDDRVAAYFTLSSAAIANAEATGRVTKGMPRHDLPAILLARLAVDAEFQGQGLGGVVLERALRRCLRIAEAAHAADPMVLPVRAVLVHAKDEDAAGFYEHAGFERSPTDPLHLMMLVKDLKRLLT